MARDSTNDMRRARRVSRFAARGICRAMSQPKLPVVHVPGPRQPRRGWLAAGLAMLVACSAPVATRPQAPVAAPGPLPAGERWITVSDGAKLYLHIAGKGPVCLFLHGGPGQDSLSFEQMGGSALEAFATMVYLDQRGSGKSPDAGDYHLDRVVQDFDEVRSQLGVDKLCLIAHSFGGILAVAYARRYPAHVSQLVM